MLIKNSFDVASLESGPLEKLFDEVTSFVEDITIEVFVKERGHRSREEHPATTIGLAHQRVLFY